MDYKSVFINDAPETDLVQLFTEPLDSDSFASALTAAALPLWSGNSKQASSLARLIRCGGSLLVKYTSANVLASGTEDDTDLQPTDASNGPPDSNTPPQETPPGSPKGDVDDGEDITTFAAISTDPRNHSASSAQPNLDADKAIEDDITNLGSNSRRGSVFTPSGLDFSQGAQLGIENPEAISIDADERNRMVSQVAGVLRAIFTQLSELSKTHKKDGLSVLFGPPGSDSMITEAHLHSILSHVKPYMADAIASNDYTRAESLKQLILLLHAILHSLFMAFKIEPLAETSNRVLIIKGLLFTFFRVDFAETFHSLLAVTTGKTFIRESLEEKQPEVIHQSQIPSLRLSYETVMKVNVMVIALSNCPIDLIFVDKVSLSLDLTTPTESSPNVYSRYVENLDFKNSDLPKQLDSVIVPQLAAMFNYYYEVFPDLLTHSLRHSSFFGWITWNTLSSGPYLSVDTCNTLTKCHETTYDTKDPYLYEVAFHEHIKRLKYAKRQFTERNVSSPSYLVVTFILFGLMKNRSFAEYFASPSDSKIPLLDIWLCVSSYVHQYQYRTIHNTFGARIALLVTLKLTSRKHGHLDLLRDRKIDENTWKLCHHKNPLIPLDENIPKKPALLYMLDVLQATLRYNLSKKIDLQNAKLALTTIYQILLELEANPNEGMRTYAWRDFCITIFQFLVFLFKNHNEEAVKTVVEEVFSIFEILLGPVYDKTLVKSTDFFSIGSHIAKSVNFDLMYIMLQQRDHLEELFDRFITRKGNFERVERTFNALNEMFSKEHKELNPNEVTSKLNELSILRDEENTLTTVDMGKFNYADTFKFLDSLNHYESFDKQQDLVHLFVLLFEVPWVGKH